MSYDYHLPPPQQPIRPVDQMKKYFYTILFVKSYVYNVKGQAIIFRRKSIESLMKLINDFDETYLHSSYEHSYQNRALSEGNVDFLVRYTDNLDEVIGLIDQNSFIVKLSWQPHRAAPPYPPHVIENGIPCPPLYPPYPGMGPGAAPYINPMQPTFPPSHYTIPPTGTPPHPSTNLQRMVAEAVSAAIDKNNEEHIKRVKIVRVHRDTRVIEVRQWDDTNKVFLTMQQPVNVGAYSTKLPDWRPGDDALLIDDKYLQRINDTPNYRRVKITDISLVTTSGIIYVADFDDKSRTITSSPYAVDLKAYCYAGKIPAWHVNDDALLFDNKYLTKLDVPEVTEGTINIVNNGLDWSNIDGSDDYYYGYDDNLTGGTSGGSGQPGITGTVPNSGEGAGGYTPYYDDDYTNNYYGGEDNPTSGTIPSGNNGGCNCNPSSGTVEPSGNTDPAPSGTTDPDDGDDTGDDDWSDPTDDPTPSGNTTPSGCNCHCNTGDDDDDTGNPCPDANNPYQFPSGSTTNP